MHGMGCRKLSYGNEVDIPIFRGYEGGGSEKKSPLKIFHHLEEKNDSSIFCIDYYPFCLTFNEYQRSSALPNNYKYNGGTERIDELDLGWDMTQNRIYRPDLGRFMGNDGLADMFPSLGPSLYSYNNPVKLNDPTGLIAQIDRRNKKKKKKKAILLKNVTITATRLPNLKPDYSKLINNGNPIYRSIGLKFRRGETKWLRRAFNRSNQTIRWTGFKGQTQWGKDFNSVVSGVYVGVGGSMLAAFGSPVLLEALGSQGVKFGIGFGQDIGTQLLTGTNIGDLDYFDATISGVAGPVNLGKGAFFGAEFIKAAVDVRLGSNNGVAFRSVLNGKSMTSFGIDAAAGSLVGFGNLRMNQDGASKAVINTINGLSSLTTGFVGDKVKEIKN